jgi:hypothetical protein
MEQKLKTSCTKPNCNCIEIAEQKNGGNPVKSYECLMPNEIELVKTGFQKQAEMTNEQKAQAWFDEWKQQFTDLQEHPAWREKGMVDYAAFCLDKRDSYWRIRCELAEKCLEESPCDPDISAEQIAAHKSYNEFLKNNIEP